MARIYHRESVDLGGTRRLAPAPVTREVVVVQETPAGPVPALEAVPVDELAAAERDLTGTQPLPRLGRPPAPSRKRVDA